MEQQHALLDTAAGGLLVAFLVGTDGICGVALQQVDIAHGIIHLVEILRILIRTGHRLQPADHLLRVTTSHHLAHGDAGIELQLVGGIHAHHATEGLIGIVALAQCGIQLTQQEVFAGFLLAAHLVLDGFLQVGNGFLEAFRVDIVRGVGIVPLLHGTPVHRVALHLIDYVLGIVDPVLLNIAFGQPCTGFTVDGRLGVIEACHIGKGRGSLGELSAMELRASHQHPCFPEEGIVFAPREPLNVALGLLPALVPCGALLDAVALDGLLRLLHGLVEISLSQFSRRLVADRIERNHLGEVVFVALLFLERAVDIGQVTIIIGIIAGRERMIPARLRRVLLGGTRVQHEHAQQNKHQPGTML